MKQLLLLMSFCISCNVFSQKADSLGNCIMGEDDKVFVRSETAPSFPESDGKIEAYLKKNFNTKAIIENGAAKGKYKISLRFIVLKDGVCCDFSAESSNGFGIEEEAIRVVKNGPKWNNALQNNHPVNAYARPTIELDL